MKKSPLLTLLLKGIFSFFLFGSVLYGQNVFLQQDVECPFGTYRSVNRSGQCVWNSIENLGVYNGEPKLYNITKTDRRCQGGANPSDAARVLNSLGVKFKQTTNKTEGLKLIREAMKDGRACMFSVPGHAMNIIHFDEAANRVIYVNNNAPRTNQLITVEKFHQMWRGWVLVIYPPSYEIKIKPWLPQRKIGMWYYAPNGRLGKVNENL